jgi:hypothetical protein
MNAPQSTRTTNASLAGSFLILARYYRGNRWALAAVVVVVAIVGGMALNWSWLVAAGIAPVLLTALPCVLMCGLGLCMNKLVGKSCPPPWTRPAGIADPTDPPAAIDPAATDRPTQR